MLLFHMNETYDIPEQNLNDLLSKIEKLNKRARRIGFPEITVQVGPPVARSSKDKPRFTNWCEVTVNGETPKLAGWTFIAVLDWMPEGTFVRKLPDCKIDLAQYRNAAPICQHCNARRNRKQIYLLSHEDGRFVQVGSSCLLDFLGGGNPHDIAAQAEVLFSLSELMEEAREVREGGFTRTMVGIEELLEQTAQVLLHLPYISKSASRAAADAGDCQTATASTVSAILFPPPRVSDFKEHPYNDLNLRVVTEDARTVAAAARSMVIEKLSPKDVANTINDFESNLLLAAKCEAVPLKVFGVAVYIIPFYRRELEKAAAAQAEAGNHHFGEVGKRYRKQKVNYIASHGFEGTYGYTFIHRLRTQDGAVLVWKTGTSLGDIQPGEELNMDFTVKAHGDFRGKIQTDVTRCAMKD